MNEPSVPVEIAMTWSVALPALLLLHSCGGVHRLIVAGARQVCQNGFSATRNSTGRISKSLPRQTIR
jgi:hypothetical protein